MSLECLLHFFFFFFTFPSFRIVEQMARANIKFSLFRPTFGPDKSRICLAESDSTGVEGFFSEGYIRAVHYAGIRMR